MSTSTQPTQWERTTTRRFLRWLFSGRTVRRALVSLAWVVTLIALLYGEENWRGRRTWNSYRRQLEAQGAQFDLSAFFPPPIPDDRNFAATPFVESWFPKASQWDDNFGRVADRISNREEAKERGERHFNNLVAWQMAFEALKSGSIGKHESFESTRLDTTSRSQAAPAVLEGLKDDEAIWTELRAASRRPLSRYPVVYDLNNPWGILLPHLARIKAVSSRLQLKASAELALGHTDAALEDVGLLLHLADSIKDEPFLVSYLVRGACLEIASRPIWEGLAEHRWSEAQIEELQTRFQQYDLLTDLKRPREAERAAVVLTADLLYEQKYRISDLATDSSGASTLGLASGFANCFGQVAPHGWYHLEKVNACRLYQSQTVGAFDPAQRQISPRRLASEVREFEDQISGGRLVNGLRPLLHHQVLASLLLPGLSQIPLKAAIAQVGADQVVLACALERARLADGRFPEKLDDLVPRFITKLPRDPVGGAAYRYRRTSDDRFVLYSIGWNEQDDGGVAGSRLFDEREGDWVWRYPAP